MSKKQIKRIIFMGLGCAALLIAAVIYSLLYNEGRWVKEMDMSTYVFTSKGYPYAGCGSLNCRVCCLYPGTLHQECLFKKNTRIKNIPGQSRLCGDSAGSSDF